MLQVGTVQVGFEFFHPLMRNDHLDRLTCSQTEGRGAEPRARFSCSAVVGSLSYPAQHPHWRLTPKAKLKAKMAFELFSGVHKGR